MAMQGDTVNRQKQGSAWSRDLHHGNASCDRVSNASPNEVHILSDRTKVHIPAQKTESDARLRRQQAECPDIHWIRHEQAELTPSIYSSMHGQRYVCASHTRHAA